METAKPSFDPTTPTVSETQAAARARSWLATVCYRQYSLKVLEYSRGQLPHDRQQTKQEQYRDQNRPYIQLVLKHNFSVHQPLHLPDAAIPGKPGATGRIS